MIVFDLRCYCGYQFEGWFGDHQDYARQAEEGLLCCPQCGDSRVHKIMSPIAMIGTGQRQKNLAPAPETSSLDEKQLQTLLTKVKDYIERNFEDVGANLATTALKIHYGVEEPRDIRGVVTAQEEAMLNNEGIQLIKVPMIKESDESQ